MQEILPLWLRVIRGTLRTNKSMYQNSKKTQDSSKIHAATAYQSLIMRVPLFLVFSLNEETPNYNGQKGSTEEPRP